MNRSRNETDTVHDVQSTYFKERQEKSRTREHIRSGFKNTKNTDIYLTFDVRIENEREAWYLHEKSLF